MSRRILIAEDEAHVIRVLKMVLEKAGYEVESASNGEIAQAAIKKNHPDVLITDIQMPRMTGDQLCKWIDAEVPDREFLIFVLTSRTSLEHREWSAAIPKLTFLEKPVSARKLLSMLDQYFDGELPAGESS